MTEFSARRGIAIEGTNELDESVAVPSSAPAQSGDNRVGGDVGAIGPPWLSSKHHFIIDLDGTLIRERSLTIGALELLSVLKGRYVIVSNNSTDTADCLARKLKRMGLPVEAEHLVLAGEQAIKMVVQHHAGARILLLASPMICHLARRLGCCLVERDADVVVLARDKTFNYRKLSVAANEVRRGAYFIVTNPDLSHPAADAGVVPETGALMAAVLGCAGDCPRTVVGKPESTLFKEGLERLVARPRDTIVIGDNPATDAAGAVRLGMRYLLVGSTPTADAETLERLLRLNCTANRHLQVKMPRRSAPL